MCTTMLQWSLANLITTQHSVFSQREEKCDCLLPRALTLCRELACTSTGWARAVQAAGELPAALSVFWHSYQPCSCLQSKRGGWAAGSTSIKCVPLMGLSLAKHNCAGLQIRVSDLKHQQRRGISRCFCQQ